MAYENNSRNNKTLGTGRDSGELKLIRKVRFNWQVPKPTPEPPPATVEPVAEAPPTSVRRSGWTIADEYACRSRCKRCGQRIAWGRVVERWGDVKDRRTWIPLDPDYMPHSCRKEAHNDEQNAAMAQDDYWESD